jgi:hypothetical protein
LMCGRGVVRAFPFNMVAIHVPHYTDRRHGVSTTNSLPYDYFRALDMLVAWAQSWAVSTSTASTQKVMAW